MDDGSSTPPQLLPLETESQSKDGSSTPPQLSPLETESRRSMGGTGSSTSTPPQLPSNFNLQRLGLKSEITPDLVSKWRRALAAGKTVGLVDQPPEKVGQPPTASIIPATSISIGPNWRLPPWTSEAESRRSMGATGTGTGTSTSTPPQLRPNFNILQPQLPSATQIRSEDGTIQLPPNFNLLQEVKLMKHPPLGLKLEKTPEFLATYWNWRLARATRKPVGQPLENLGNNASIIPATSISIGPNWRRRRESSREDHLTLKFYYKKKKLVWEFLEGPLKEKIEVSWFDITAIDAHIPDNQPGSLQIQLGNKPSFFRETPPQPRKHTIWEKTTDFTHGQAASRHRIYEAEFDQGVLDEHYPKLLLSNQRLLELSKNPFPYPTRTQGESAPYFSTIACLPSTSQQQHQHSLSVNNPTQSIAAASQSHLNPIPMTVGVGESSRNANLQTPVLLPSTLQQLPFSFTGVEQSLPFNNPTPSIVASQYLTAVVSSRRIGERSFHMQSESSRNDDHHHQTARIHHHNQPLPDELYQYQNNLSRINYVPANVDQPTMENIAAHPNNSLSTLERSNIDAGEQLLTLGSINHGGVTAEQRPELDGDIWQY